LSSVHVSDAQAAGCARTAAEIAADRGSSTFAPNDSYSYQCSKATVTTSFTNSATATGSPAAGPDVTATDTADVTVINPAITISKLPATRTILTGSTATFTIKVTNTGDVDLTNVTVNDAKTPSCNKVVGNLAKGASTSYDCTTDA